MSRATFAITILVALCASQASASWLNQTAVSKQSGLNRSYKSVM